MAFVAQRPNVPRQRDIGSGLVCSSVARAEKLGTKNISYWGSGDIPPNPAWLPSSLLDTRLSAHFAYFSTSL